MSIATVLARGRAAAERRMVDECVIVRVTGTTTDLSSGDVTETIDPVYAGKCEVQQQAATARDDTVGESSVLLVGRTLKLPVLASIGVLAGDRVTITACVHDPDLVDRQFSVRAEFGKSHATARRIGIEEVTS